MPRPLEDVMEEYLRIRPDVSSLRQAARKMGMHHTTLSRALNRASKAGHADTAFPTPSARVKRIPPSRSTRPLDQVLEDYTLIRYDVDSVADAAERMGMSWEALDQALYRARKRGVMAALPPPGQLERAMVARNLPRILKAS